MVIDNGGDDLRSYEAYFNFLKANRVPIVAGNTTTARDAKVVLEQSLEYAFSDQNIRNNFIQQMKMHSVLPLGLNEFEWLNENHRACNWVWLFLRLYEEPDNYNQQQKTYEIMGLKNITSSSKERFNEIVKFFDLRLVDNNRNLAFLNFLKDEWSKINRESHYIKWLKQDKSEQCDWAWSYQLKAEQQLPFNSYFHPVNSEEKYHSMMACLDYTGDTIYAKNFIKNINHARSQKKFRDKNKNKIPLNTYLKRKTKERLKELAAIQEINITEMIDRLINSAYKELV